MPAAGESRRRCSKTNGGARSDEIDPPHDVIAELVPAIPMHGAPSWHRNRGGRNKPSHDDFMCAQRTRGHGATHMIIRVYVDGGTTPVAELAGSSGRIKLDTTAIPDGLHRLRIETVDGDRVTGQREVPF